MISYIFKNKTKNILAIIFTLLYIIVSDLPYDLYFSVVYYGMWPFLDILRLLPYLLILIYLFTLKKQYRFKNWLFPTSFAILGGLALYIIITDIVFNITQYCCLILTNYLQYSVIIISFVSSVFCFLGSIKNFKNVILLRAGTFIMMICFVASQVLEFFLLGGADYFASIPAEYLATTYSGMIKGIVKLVIMLLFYFGIFNLTLNKKSEDIDITPFVEERKAKKAAKLQQKAAEELADNAQPPEAPDGSWRCMACGKILPDEQQKCECGYKK